MNLKEFKNELFKKAAEEGFSEYEIYYKKNDNLQIQIFEKELDKYSVADTTGLSFRGIYNGKMGYASTEILDDKSIEILVKSAKDNALSVDSDDQEFIYGDITSYETVDVYNDELSKLSADEKIKLALKLEEKIKNKSDKITKIKLCWLISEETETGIMNSKGIDLSFKQNSILAVASPLVTDGTRVYDALEVKSTNDLSELNIEELADKCVKKALNRIGASSIKSGKYKVAIQNDTIASLLKTFSGIFNAENCQKGLSLLTKNKIGTTIASNVVTLTDNPLLEGGDKSMPFDAEGVATYKKSVIEKGELKTLLYNLKAAAKDGVKTTGNASKTAYAQPITIAPSNFYIEAGEKSFDDLIKIVGEGLLITSFEGMHAGANPVTGDFSLSTKGFLIENGKVTTPVEQITASGNFYKLLDSIEDIADDIILQFGFGSPTIVVKELSIAGE